jgi:stage IV sporulation protein FB
VSSAARPSRAIAWSFPVGRILGIPIRLHVTFVFLLVLFAAAGSLPWLVMAFACVLLHELAHSVTAKRHGAEVAEIILLPIGGASRIRNLGDDPRVEALVTAVGPLTSLGLAGAAALVATALGQELFPPGLHSGGFLARIAWFNLLVGGFNLIPAFPMDGGRLLRALLSRRHDPETATRIAATVGRAIAGAMFAIGVFFNVWLVLIAVFVYLGASTEETAAAFHTRARGLHVGDVMLLDPLSVDGHASVDDVREALRHSAQPAFPVTDHGQYLGILDAATVRRSPLELLAGDVADRGAPTLDSADPVDPDALEALEDSGRSVLAVLHGGRVVGLLRDEEMIERVTGATKPDSRPSERP